MPNMLLEAIDFKEETTGFGTWRKYMYPNGRLFSEFTSHQTILGRPLFHYTYGINPETGRRIVASGIIAIGRLAKGVIAIGHASFGLIAIGQLAIGILVGFGQASTGCIAIGQLALGLFFGAGQIVTGLIAIGQIAFGKYVLAQAGMGKFVWSVKIKNPAAISFFKSLLP